MIVVPITSVLVPLTVGLVVEMAALITGVVERLAGKVLILCILFSVVAGKLLIAVDNAAKVLPPYCESVIPLISETVPDSPPCALVTEAAANLNGVFIVAISVNGT